MRAYEYLAEILPDGHLSIPEDLKGKLSGESKIRVMLLLEDENAQWNNFTELISRINQGHIPIELIRDTSLLSQL